MNSAEFPDRGASLEDGAEVEFCFKRTDELVVQLQPGELLRRIAMDPAREYLQGICRKCLMESAFLMDASILCAAAAAHVVVGLTGVAPLQWVQGVPVPEAVGHAWEEWIGGRVEGALQMLLREDREAHAAGMIQPEPGEPRHGCLVSWLEIEEGDVLGAAVRFNGLSELDRRAFFLVFVEARAMDDCLGVGLGAPTEILQRAESAIRTMVTPPPPEAPMDFGGLLP